MSETPIVTSVAPLTKNRTAWLVDVWGVIHNGVEFFEPATTACVRFREQGGYIALVTNAPRPSVSVMEQIDRIGVPRAAYDAIVTSGDVTRGLIQAFTQQGKRIHHLGPERDLPLFADLIQEFATSVDADVVVCTGLHDDETETPDDYRLPLDRFLRRGVPMICANPDLKVDRGGKVVYCAGALAEAYLAVGGEVIFAGKPYLPIYELARGIVEKARGGPVAPEMYLAIGDGILTDIAGAANAGLDSVYIASRIHLAPGALTDAAVAEAFAASSRKPIAAMRELTW